MTSIATLSRRIIQSTTVGFAVLDQNHKILEVNEAFCQIYGFTASELMQQPFSTLSPTQFRERAQLSYQNYVAGDAEQAAQYIQRKDGTRQYVQLTTDTFTSEDGLPLELVSVVSLPQKVSQSLPSPDTLLDCGGVGMVHCTPEGFCTGFNQAAQQLLDIRHQAVMDQEISVVSGNAYRRLSLIDWLQDQGDQVVNQEILLDNMRVDTHGSPRGNGPRGNGPRGNGPRGNGPRGNGPYLQKQRWLLINAQLQENIGKPYWAVHLTDITTQKQREIDFQEKAESLSNANRRLEDFVSGATHDLKAPLSSMLGLLQIFRLEDDADQQDAYLQLIEKSIHRLDKLILEVIDYTKNVHQEVSREKIDFHTLLSEVLESMEYMEHASEIKKEISITQSAPFFSDAHRLNVILNNMISNAYKYSSTHRRQGFVQIEIDATAKRVHIQISDNGQGIPEAQLGKIFDRGYRASNEGASGSGLGLYFVKEAIDKMGGTVHVSSSLGQGTCFTIDLPASPPTVDGQMRLDI